MYLGRLSLKSVKNFKVAFVAKALKVCFLLRYVFDKWLKNYEKEIFILPHLGMLQQN